MHSVTYDCNQAIERAMLISMRKRGKRGFGHVYRRGKIWWVKCHKDGIPFYQSTKSENKKDADQLLKELLSKDAVPMRTDRVMVKDLITDCLTFYEAQRPKSYQDFALPVAKALLAFFSHHKVSQVTTAELNRYRAKRKAKGKAVATVNREMAFLRRAFNQGKETTPPKVLTAPKFPMEKENNVRQGFLSVEAYGALLAAMDDEIKGLLVVGYHLGCRRSELQRLRWANVDLADGFIRLVDTKNGDTREAPIYGDMVETLATLRAKTPRSCPWVFNRGGKRIKDFRHGWEAACEAVGMPNLLFHDLRRSAVRNMIFAGVPERLAMEISGHKTRAVFDRYAIMNREDKREAGKKLGAYLKNAERSKKASDK